MLPDDVDLNNPIGIMAALYIVPLLPESIKWWMWTIIVKYCYVLLTVVMVQYTMQP